MARKSRRKQGSKGRSSAGDTSDTPPEADVEETEAAETEAEAEEAEVAEAESAEAEASEDGADKTGGAETGAEDGDGAQEEQERSTIDGLPVWWDAMEAAFEALDLAIRGPEAEAEGDGDDALTTAASAPRAPTAQALDVVDAIEEEEAPPVPAAVAATVELPLDDGTTLGDERLKIFDEKQASWETLEALHDDIHRLFRLGDVAGALLSMERLVTLSAREPRIDAFLDRNADRLLTVYERLFDGFDHCPELTDGTEGTEPDLRIVSKIAHVYRAVDGQRTIRDLLTSLEVPQVEVAALLHHLVRTRRARIPI